MISLLMLLAIFVAMTLQTVFQKSYNARTINRGAFTFSAISPVAAAAVFAVYMLAVGTAPSFSVSYLPYSAAFGISYGLSVVFTVLALQFGPVSLTALLLAFSLLIPTLYGFLFLGNTPTPLFLVGAVLLAVSLVLINLKKEDRKVNVKWLICIAVAFVGNGMCSTVQTKFVNDFAGAGRSEFMLLALVIVIVLMLVVSFVRERKALGDNVKNGFLQASGYGIANGIINLFVMLLVARGEMPVSIIFPSISACSMIGAFLLSTFLYREKMSTRQVVGFFIGAGAVILLNV